MGWAAVIEPVAMMGCSHPVACRNVMITGHVPDTTHPPLNSRPHRTHTNLEIPHFRVISQQSAGVFSRHPTPYMSLQCVLDVGLKQTMIDYTCQHFVSEPDVTQAISLARLFPYQ